MRTDLRSRYLGSLLGLACGDAVGTTVEFQPRDSFPLVTDMVGGGPFGLLPGQWTDDTSMALCLAESLLARGEFDARDQMARYLKWRQQGYLSSTGECFDIGMTVARALDRFRATGDPFAGSTDPQTAGNGSLMRLAPVALFYFPDVGNVIRFCGESSRTTHAASEAIECCKLLGLMLAQALSGMPRERVVDPRQFVPVEPKVAAIAQGGYLHKSREQIRGTGYCVASLEAALWCFHRTDTFEAAILEGANLGDDADTTAAIVGQLAGAYYGMEDIPDRWLRRIHMGKEIASMAEALHATASAR